MNSEDIKTLRLFLPLPPAVLSPNVVSHWSVKAAAKKSYRQIAWAVAREAIGRGRAPRWAKATIQCRFWFQTNRQRDPDNMVAWMKAAFDGIADAGVVKNDSGFVHLPVSTGTVAAMRGAGVEITIEPA